jgi:Domain of unknown function DUF11
MIRRFSLAVGSALAVAAIATPASAQTVPTADLAIVSITPSVTHARVGQDISFTIVATNNGPDVVELDTSVTRLRVLRFVSETCDLGISPDTPFCEYGFIEPGVALTTTFVGRVRDVHAKFASVTACASSELALNDPVAANDCATARVKLIGKRG